LAAQEAQELSQADGIGTRGRFGKFVKALRTDSEATLEDWSARLNIKPPVLSRIEAGKHKIPERDELILWGKLLQLDSWDLDELLIAAGHLPVTGFAEASISNKELHLLAGALREVFKRSDTDPTGFIDMLGKVIEQKIGQDMGSWRAMTTALKGRIAATEP
jgi:hypothetical protein